MSKKEIRSDFLEKRRSFSQEQVQEKSALIFEKLFSLEEFSQAKNIGVYVSFKKEVETIKIIEKLLKDGKNIYSPVMDIEKERFSFAKISSLDSMIENKYGVLEPTEKELVDVSKIEVFLVPGAVFDLQGNRIGWGKGYYDKFFGENKTNGTKIGLFFEFQKVEAIDPESFDVKMDFIVTEKQIYKF